MKTISQIHDDFDSGALNPSSLVESLLQKISESKTNSFISVLTERSRAQAKDLTDQLRTKYQGKVPRNEFPLFGIPIGIKDAITIEGYPTTCASRVLENYHPPFTATAVHRLENAGAISIGKLNLDEFAMGSSNENSAFGPVLHPTHPDRVPGGSSGGSAAAVREGLCVASLGTDTGGSIRLPASFCGVVGFKPTYGRISRYGQIAFASSLDQIGPLASSVEDAARLYEVMAGFDPKDSTTLNRNVESVLNSAVMNADLKGLRVGVPREYFDHLASDHPAKDALDPEVKAAIENVLQALNSKGSTIVSVDLPHTRYAISTYYVIAVCEASSNLSRYDGVRFGVRPKDAENAKTPIEYYKKVRALFGPEVKRRILLGTFALSSGYYDAYYRKAAQVRRLIRNDFESAFQHCDVMISPVAPSTAFRLGEKSKDPLKMYLTDIFTIPASLAGLPGMSLPVGQDSSGLPIGLQILAPRCQEKKLFEAAFGIEKVMSNQVKGQEHP